MSLMGTVVHAKNGDSILPIAVNFNLSELVHCELDVKVCGGEKDLTINAPSKAIAWMLWIRWELLEELLASHRIRRVAIQACGKKIIPIQEVERLKFLTICPLMDSF